MHHKERGAIRAEAKHPLNLKGANALFGTAKQVPSNQPFSERDMRILKNRTNGYRELLFAFGALIQTGADVLVGIRFDLPNPFLLIVFAMRKNDSKLPADSSP